MKVKPTSKARRNFLLTLGLTGAGAAAVALIKQTPEQAAQVAGNEPAAGRGYQETDHVRNYYKTTRV
jgi:hypothetical protein